MSNTFSTAAEQLAALRAPFDPSLILTREQGGTELSYYPAHTIQNRLLDVLGAGLSITTERTEITEDRVDLSVRLTILWVDGSVSRIDGWGSADILRSKSGSNKVVNDPMKAAYTDALKVAASKLGVGLELYDKEYIKSLDNDATDKKPTQGRDDTPREKPSAAHVSRFKRGA